MNEGNQLHFQIVFYWTTLYLPDLPTYIFKSFGGYGDISKGGYCIAKGGNIMMTRLFANCTPSLEEDGVKSYALAPAMTHTQLAMYTNY